MAKGKSKKKYIVAGIVALIVLLAVLKSAGVFGTPDKSDTVTAQEASSANIVQIVTASGQDQNRKRRSR